MKALLLILLVARCFHLEASEPSQMSSLRKALSAVPAPDRPVLVVKWIKEAPAERRELITINAVKQAVEINPAAAALLVGAIGRAVPEMVALAAATAAAKQAAQADAITRAGVAVVPAMAGRIVAAVCKAVPGQYRSVAIGASEAAPGAWNDILRSVSLSIPDLRQRLEKEVASYGLMPPPVAVVLDRVGVPQIHTGASTGPISSGLSSPGPMDASPNGTEHGKHGGRNYAKP